MCLSALFRCLLIGLAFKKFWNEPSLQYMGDDCAYFVIHILGYFILVNYSVIANPIYNGYIRTTQPREWTHKSNTLILSAIVKKARGLNSWNIVITTTKLKILVWMLMITYPRNSDRNKEMVFHFYLKNQKQTFLTNSILVWK